MGQNPRAGRTLIFQRILPDPVARHGFRFFEELRAGAESRRRLFRFNRPYRGKRQLWLIETARRFYPAESSRNFQPFEACNDELFVFLLAAEPIYCIYYLYSGHLPEGGYIGSKAQSSAH
jgi:hypothetical protein